MFCNNCGKEIDDNAVVCPHCGVAVNTKSYNGQSQFQPQADNNTIAIVGFVFFVPVRSGRINLLHSRFQ